MAGASLLTLIDDIASMLDDVSVMTKVAAKKTAGVLGDDLALNAQQVTGVAAERELPVVWAVAKGSLLNKAILVPVALALSALVPWVIIPLLMLGGAFLCFEGFEKVMHKLLHHEADAEHDSDPVPTDPVAWEKDRIKGAVRTDFILSAEIIIITLGTVTEETLGRQLVVLTAISIVMTLGVYGLVAGIVKLDDAGLHLAKQSSSATQAVGRGILGAAPWLMKALGVIGTIAMFLVGGGIVNHNVPALHHGIQHITHAAAEAVGHAAEWVVPTLLDGLVGIVVGAVAVGLVTAVGRLRGAAH